MMDTNEDEIEMTDAMVTAGVEAFAPFWADARDEIEGVKERAIRETLRRALSCTSPTS